MLIFYYLSLGIIALGLLAGAGGIVLGLRWSIVVRHPPVSEEDEQRRKNLGTVAASLVIIGALLSGVGVLFR
jgi:hypothetical protein